VDDEEVSRMHGGVDVNRRFRRAREGYFQDAV
jgi:hypothetical protein